MGISRRGGMKYCGFFSGRGSDAAAASAPAWPRAAAAAPAARDAFNGEARRRRPAVRARHDGQRQHRARFDWLLSAGDQRDHRRAGGTAMMALPWQPLSGSSGARPVQPWPPSPLAPRNAMRAKAGGARSGPPCRPGHAAGTGRGGIKPLARAAHRIRENMDFLRRQHPSEFFVRVAPINRRHECRQELCLLFPIMRVAGRTLICMRVLLAIRRSQSGCAVEGQPRSP